MLTLVPIIALGLVITMQKITQMIPANLRYVWQAALLAVIMAFPVVAVVTYAINPRNADIYADDKSQYVTSATWGLRDEVMPYLKTKTQGGSIFVGVKGLKGTPQAIELYAYPTNNIKSKGYLWWDETYEKDLRDLLKQAGRVPTYYLGDGLKKPHSQIKLIRKFDCEDIGGVPCSIPLYEVTALGF